MKRKIFTASFIITLVIVLGFLFTSIYSYFTLQKLFKEDVKAVSQLTSENIFFNINNFVDRPLNVSLAMANDTFLKDFIVAETSTSPSDEKINKLKTYLAAYQKEYKFNSVFFVSEQTGNYYHYDLGLSHTLSIDNKEDSWYYDFLANPDEYALNMDNDQAKDNIPTIFVNCKLTDSNDKTIGVVGVGMDAPYIQGFLRDSELSYGVKAYLIDVSGKIQISSALTGFQNINIFDNEVFASMKTAIIHNTQESVERWYQSKDADGYIISRYIPDLNWYLVVEKSVVDFKVQILRQIAIDGVFTLIVMIIVISIVVAIDIKNKKALIYQAEIDPLTGVKNRNAYELEVLANKENLDELDSFAIGVFDLNNLKKINDVNGHQAGDEYIKKVSSLISSSFDYGSIFRIGGDEFAVTFVNVSEKQLKASLEDFNKKISEEKLGSIPLSTAFGYAFYDKDKLNDIDMIFEEADHNMYLHKKKMKGL